MGDSDDEFDRRRGRDKFRGERNDYERRPRGDYRENRRPREEPGWGDRKRNDSWEWQDKRPRDGWESRKRGDSGAGYYREMDRGRRDSGGRPGSPPMKRVRRDWNNEEFHPPGGVGGMPQGGAPMWPFPDVNMQAMEKLRRPDNFQDAPGEIPRMMSFKEFLLAQEDDINEVESVRRYKEYSLEFKRTQLSDFFVLHKNEEWFKEKYHPVDRKRKQQETRQSLRRRLRVFLDLLEDGLVDDLSLDHDKQDELIRFMDTVVVQLEGGGPADIALLEEASVPHRSSSSVVIKQEGSGDSQAASLGVTGAQEQHPSSLAGGGANSELHAVMSQSEKPSIISEQEQVTADSTDSADKDATPSSEKMKKKRRSHGGRFYTDCDEENNDDEELDSASDSDSGTEATKTLDAGPTADEEMKIKDEPSSPSNPDNTSQPVASDNAEASAERGEETADSPHVAAAVDTTSEDTKADVKQAAEDSTSADDQPEKQMALSGDNDGNKADVNAAKRKTITVIKPNVPLHKTLSLFMRHVVPTISKADICMLCKRYPGFMRVTLSEPSPERRFERRGWVTFRPDVNIKDICWTMSNIKMKDSDLNPIVNRELAKRVRPVSGLTVTKHAMKFDLEFAVKLIKALDEKHKLYAEDEQEDEVPTKTPAEAEDTSEKQPDTVETASNVTTAAPTTTPSEDAPTTEEVEKAVPPVKINLPAVNPVLTIVDSTELPPSPEPESTDDTTPDDAAVDKTDVVVKNEKVLDVIPPKILSNLLDKLLLYLRVVHSVDYYNGTDYPFEDEMPSRCGIIHVRGAPPGKATHFEVDEWTKNLEQKLSSHIKTACEKLSEEDATLMGKKSVEVETENFVKANSQEKGKDKWLCPLSGKKFRGPEFVRKHIFNKHSDKIDEVKQEVDFFNTYLFDPARPHFPAPPPMRHVGNWPQRGPPMHGARAPFTPPFGNFVGNFNRNINNTFPPKPRGGGMHQRDPRAIVHYRDLDAPDNTDFF